MRQSAVAAIAAWITCAGYVQSLRAQPRYLVLEEARRAVAEAADTFPTFEADPYIYDRAGHHGSWSRLLEANYSPDIIVDLLADGRPRVRTLAIALLFSKEDPNLLMPVAQLLADTSQTFPMLLPTDNMDPRATAPQTVGWAAKQFLGAYLLAAGMDEWRDPKFEDWVTYSSSHRNRPYSLSWLIVRMSRIAALQSPFPESRRPRLLAFRKELDRLPPEDRDLYLLWLSNGNPEFDGGRVLATETELVEAAKRLGRQKLLQIVDGRPPGSDPDLPATEQWFSRVRYQSVVSFILAHADRLFSAADEPFLAAIEQGLRDEHARKPRALYEIIQLGALGRARAMLVESAR